MDNPSNAAILSALEGAWAAIQKHHPDTPNVRLILASGRRGNQYRVRGHFWPLQWQVGGYGVHEVMIAGERLSDGPEAVLCTLLHEAAHGVAQQRGIKDCCRQGRFHKKVFADHAHELGLTTEWIKRQGARTTGLAEGTAEKYRAEIDALEKAIGDTFRVRPEDQGADAGEEKKKARKKRTPKVVTLVQHDALALYEAHHYPMYNVETGDTIVTGTGVMEAFQAGCLACNVEIAQLVEWAAV